ncbi:hypothetical protein ASPWEDRAFT_744468 [Aspergillus wentii DTO 134E9]|uniref:Sodium/calcium exchanger membrane region domain-containing protein n=1 Tax=Aspergillus wentii DTO 134E9 TaxID=1073089 RepID=A0A1L9REE7_ASPWE|nr:uncharacterized protein ASPWEDRAFT_744468 [Aspergillus wentii DTO 134E9]OJJ33300.1 hypothetical protein ASPWEDRAFT_744468 [Aspergillus wentii DTO 134E9]
MTPSPLDRIHSWAKAHASSRGTSSQDSSGLPTTQVPEEKTEPPIRNGQVNESSSTPGSSSGEKTIENEPDKSKPGLPARMKNGSIRFCGHFKDALCHSWVNVLLVFVPAGIAVEAAGLSPGIVFAMNAVAIIPLAGMLSFATECVASRLGDSLGALINVTFGNAVELIIFIIALVKNEIRIVQASLLGSILANLLLILGMAFLLGGLRFQEQIYNSTVTQMSACLLSLSVMSLLLPTAFHASWSDSAIADRYTLKVSRGTSVLKSHSYLYASIPQQIIDEESHPGVLADLMNSSSDSSSSSSSDSDDTTTSWSTAKRIKKAMKYRRHRKSSTSSKGTAARQAIRKSALADLPVPGTSDRGNSVGGSSSSHLDEAGSCAIDFGDDRYDADDDGKRDTVPRSRDFGQLAIDLSREDHHAKKREKKQRKKEKKERKQRKVEMDTAKQDAVVASAPIPARPSLKSHISEPFVDRGEPIVDDNVDIPKRRSPFRPTIPSFMSNTVFSNTAALPNAAQQPPPPGAPGTGLRRTNSLPTKINRPPPVGNAVQFARGAARVPNVVDATAVKTTPEHHEPQMSRTSAVVMLLLSTALVAVCAEFLVDAIPGMIESSNVSQAFIGLIILPIVGNAAEHVTAVSVATKNKMDLSIGVSVGSSIQIAIFVTPLVVILGWCMDKDMSLYFTLFETICLFVTAFVVNFLVLDGRSNYLEGALLMAAYVIIAVAAFFYPSSEQSSQVAGAGY